MQREASDQLEQQLVSELERLSVPVEIAPYRDCCGRMYYEWQIASKCRHGIACTFPDAVREAVDSLLKAS